jgi:nucleoside-diphosphate-sugar epimerase
MLIKKIFLTGASGYIGGTVAQLLVEKGFEVSGLIRNPALAGELLSRCITPIIGTIEDSRLIAECAGAADAVINTADHQNAFLIDSILRSLKGTGKTFIHTSGSSLLGGKDLGEKSDFIYTEDFPLTPRMERAFWINLNNEIIRSSRENIRSIVVVPTMVYGQGLGIHKESVQIPNLWKLSREKGMGVHIESGSNIWSNVHVVDLARLYIDILEKAKAGSYFYAENGEASLFDIAVSISKKMGAGSNTILMGIQEAVDYFGAELAHFALASNSRCSADKARLMLGWKPEFSSIFEFI